MIKAEGMNPDDYDEQALLNYYEAIVSEENSEEDFNYFAPAHQVFRNAMIAFADAYQVIDLESYNSNLEGDESPDLESEERLLEFIDHVIFRKNNAQELFDLIDRPIETRAQMIARMRGKGCTMS